MQYYLCNRNKFKVLRIIQQPLINKHPASGRLRAIFAERLKKNHIPKSTLSNHPTKFLFRNTFYTEYSNGCSIIHHSPTASFKKVNRFSFKFNFFQYFWGND